MNYRDKIRKFIECPEFGNSSYGAWGSLRIDQRRNIKRLLDELDGTDDYIKKLYKENQELKEEKQELIDYLKEQITLCNERIDFHKSEISGVTNISDDNRHLILIKKNKIRKESFEEILSKIERV